MRKGTTKSLGVKEENDKFYTKPEIAAFCLSQLNIDKYDVVIEPAAGNGSFSLLVGEKCVAFDLVPEHDSIVQKNFFDFRFSGENKKVLTVGNPPFGRQNSLAVAFVNHAASFSDTIAFILPKSFSKVSLMSKLNKKVHLNRVVELPKNSFVLNGQRFHVNCNFYVFDVLRNEREDTVFKLTTDLFSFVSREEANLRIQRVGGNAGRCDDNLDVSKESNYFVFADDPVFAAKVVNSLPFASKDNTVGPRSISKRELVLEIDSFFANKNS